jgi:hypothetical protein
MCGIDPFSWEEFLEAEKKAKKTEETGPFFQKPEARHPWDQLHDPDVAHRVRETRPLRK